MPAVAEPVPLPVTFRAAMVRALSLLSVRRSIPLSPPTTSAAVMAMLPPEAEFLFTTMPLPVRPVTVPVTLIEANRTLSPVLMPWRCPVIPKPFADCVRIFLVCLSELVPSISASAASPVAEAGTTIDPSMLTRSSALTPVALRLCPVRISPEQVNVLREAPYPGSRTQPWVFSG